MRRPSGREFEFKVLGECGALVRAPYVSFWEAMEQVIYKQPNHWNPLNPTTVLGKELLDSIRNSLSTALYKRCSPHLREVIVKNTGLYCALGTSADLWHTTDAVVYCDLGFLTPLVTIDLRVNDDDPENEALRENHVIVTQYHFQEVVSKHRRRLVNISGVIADQLVSQLEDMGIISKTTEEAKAS